MEHTGQKKLFAAELIADDGTRLEVQGEKSIGRSSVNDIVIPVGEVSSKHALLRWKNSALTVEDLNSSNGTTVNGNPVKGEIELCDGDILCFEKICYVVALPNTGSSDATVVMTAKQQNVPVLPDQTVLAVADSADYVQAMGPVVVPMDIHTRGDTERASSLPHLLVLDASDQVLELLELEIGESSGPDVWEIGRNANCQIRLQNGSVSDRHAQLRHERGQWRLVNLLATNGVYVNNTKKLSATLADGDRIRLGDTQLLFREHSAQKDKVPIRPSEKIEIPKSEPEPEPSERSSKTQSTTLAIAAVFLLLGFCAYLYSLYL